MKKNGQFSTPPCKAACPAGVDVPQYIRYLKAGKFAEALSVIRDKIPFPAVCGYACVHPCESGCARAQYDQPIAIRLLKRAAAEYGQEAAGYGRKAAGYGQETAEYGQAPAALMPSEPVTDKNIAVIGAGPCGLTTAYYLAGFGHRVTVFEALSQPGGMLRYGIPEYRLPNEVLEREIDLIRARGVEIITNTRVTSPQDLLSRGFDAVLVAAGAWKGLGMNFAGTGKVQTVNGITFLNEVNSGNYPDIGKKVVVVGGGNTALDAARVAVRLGADVTIVYRRTEAEMPAAPEEISEGIEEGVKIEFLTAPVHFTEKGIVCVQMSLGPVDDSGRPKPIPVEGSEFVIACDTVIMAIGQAVDVEGFNIDINAGGTVKIDPESFATGIEGIFAAGDAVTGPSSIIEAIAQGRMASISIDKYLGGTGEMGSMDSQPATAEWEHLVPPGQERPSVQTRSAVERTTGFDLVELGYDLETAVNEAQRCLACDLREFQVDVDFMLCKGCGYCREMCSLGIFRPSDSFNPSGYKPTVASDTEKCVGCLKCLYVCPDFAINIQSSSY